MKQHKQARLLAAVVVVLALFAAACGGSDGDDGGGAASGEEARDEQATVDRTRRSGSGPAVPLDPAKNKPPADWDPNGELRIAYAAGTPSLDPAGNNIAPFLFALYDRLTEMDDDYTVQPRLMTEWSFPDSKTMLMKLRANVKFHDGTAFDGNAVKANIERYKTLPTSTVRAAFTGVDSVEVVDPLTVKLHLSKGGAELPVLFTQQPGMMVSPAAIANTPADIGTKGAGGSGPYRIESFKPNESATYVPNPDFWNKKEGLLKKLTIFGILNGPQRLNALKSDDVDLAQVIGQDTAGAKRELSAGTIQGVLANLTATQNQVMLRDTRPPFDNPKVREAVAYAINKKAIGEGLYSGTCIPADQFFLDKHWSHADSLDGAYTYDLAKAKALLAESGVANPSFTLDYSALYTLPAQAVQAQLKEAGFNVEIRVAPPGDTSFRDGKVDGTVGAIAGVFDPSQLITSYFLGGLNLLRDPDGSAAALAAKGGDPTATPEEWSEAYQELYERVYGEHIVIPTCNAQQVWAHLGKVANVDDLRYKFSGLVDFSPLYVKK